MHSYFDQSYTCETWAIGDTFLCIEEWQSSSLKNMAMFDRHMNKILAQDNKSKTYLPVNVFVY